MINLDYTISCCGINELDGIYGYKEPKKIIHDICSFSRSGYDSWIPGSPRAQFVRNFPPFLIFSADKQHTIGEKLEKYIKKHKLGPVRGSRRRNNPTGSPSLKMWMWEPAARAIWDHVNPPKRRKK